MSYTIATSEFTDINETDWIVKIVSSINPGVGSSPFSLGPDGFSLTYDFDEYDRCKPIVGSRVQITLYHPVNASVSLYFDAVYNALDNNEEGTYRIEIYRDQDTDNELWWAGEIVPEQTVIPDDYPNAPVTLTAVDGLANLKGIDYNNNGAAYTGTALVIEHLHNLIQKLHIKDIWSATDVELKFFEDYIGKEYKDNIYAGAQNKQLENAKVHHNSFYNIDQDGAKQFFTCYEVLKSLATTFNVSVFMAQGSIWWLPLGAIQSHTSNGTSIANYMLGDGTRIYNTVANVTTGAIFGSNSTQWEKLNGWERTSSPAFKEVKRQRDYQGNKPIVKDSLYTKADLSGGAILDDEDIEYPALTKFIISGYITYSYPGDGTSTDDSRVARLKLAIELRLGDAGGTEKYLSRAVTFDNTNVSYAMFYDYLSDSDPDTPQFWDHIYDVSSWEASQSSLDFVSPVFDKRLGTNAPNDGDAGGIMYVPFQMITEELPNLARGLQLSATISGLNVHGASDTDLTDSTSSITLGDFAVHNYDQDSPQEFNTLDIKAVSPDTARYILNQSSTLTGDRITDSDLGTISIYNGSSYIDSTEWTNLQSSTSELSINGLGVRERLAANKTAKRIERGALFQIGATYIHPYTVLTNSDDSGNFYQLTGLSYIASRSEYDVQCMYLSRNITGITVVQDNPRVKGTDRPPAPLPVTRVPGPDNIISINSTKITTNETDITTNVTSIATNVTSIATNVTSIATNVTNIATNVTNIATNVTDISTNASDILEALAAASSREALYLKVMPSEFHMNDDYTRAPLFIEDDVSGSLSVGMPASNTELFAFVNISKGYKATHVIVYTTASTTSAVEVFEFNHTTGAITSKGTGDFNATIDITDVSSHTTDGSVVIKVSPASAVTRIYGATITLASL